MTDSRRLIQQAKQQTAANRYVRLLQDNATKIVNRILSK
jgi:hypothetical protein